MPDRIPHCQAFLYCQLTNFIPTLKGFAQAFSKACGFRRLCLWWVLRVKPLTYLADVKVLFAKPIMRLVCGGSPLNTLNLFSDKKIQGRI